MYKTHTTATLGIMISIPMICCCTAHDSDIHRSGHSPSHGGGSVLKHYHRKLGDPHWMVRAGEFHGHLGPWVTVGAMIGEHALKQLKTLGQWEVEVICWMPPERQRQPFSCILDGLQTSTGATMGKRNIRFAYSPELVINNRPVVYVIRRSEKDHPQAGFSYRLSDHLADILANIQPDHLEAISRDIAGHDARELFEIRPMTERDFTLTKQVRQGK